jgi:hypothetical protein
MAVSSTEGDQLRVTPNGDASNFAFTKRTPVGLFAALVCFLLAVPSSCLADAENQGEEEDKPIEFHGPAPRLGYPDAFQLGYVLLKRMISPNNQYAVVFPNRLLEDNPDFIVDLKNSRILSVLFAEEPYFQSKNHASFSVNWSPDSSAALIENGGRWSPNDLVLIELKDGKVFRQTDMLAPLQKIFSAARSKSEHRHVDETEGADIAITETKWRTGKSLEMKCEGETNPKAFEESDSWNGELTAVWDVAQRKFVQHKFANVTFRRGRKEE